MSFRKFQESAKARLGVQIALGVIAFIFLVGAFYSFGPGPGMGGGWRDSVVFTVNGQRIMASQYYQNLEAYRSQYGSSLPQEYAVMYLAAVDLVRQAAVSQVAASLKLTATRDETAERREEYIQSQLEAAGPEGPERQRFLVEQGLSWQAFQDKVYTSARNLNPQFENQIIMEKLQEHAAQGVTVSDNELLAQYRTYDFHQIYIKAPDQAEIEAWEEQKKMMEEFEAAESEPTSESAAADDESQPASDAESSESDEDDRPAWLDRTEEQAVALAQDLRSQIEAGADFEEVAKDYSDDGWLASMGGLWEKVGYSQLMGMPQEVQTAVIEGAKGELSEPIVTDRGVYLIRVDNVVEENVPEDFETTKEEQREQKLNQKTATAFNEFVQDLVTQAVVEFESADPRAHIAWLIYHNRAEMSQSEVEARRLEAIDRLNEVIANDLREAELSEGGGTEFLAKDYYQLGMLYQQGEQWGDALQAQNQGLASNPVPEIKLEVARCLVELDRGAEAKPLLQEIAAKMPVETNTAVHSDIARLYRQMGEDELASATEAEVMEAQQSSGYGMPPGMMVPPGGGFSR